MRKRINWVGLVKLLSEAGLSQDELARRCETTQSSISKLASGVTGEPAHSIGDALVREFKAAIGQDSLSSIEVQQPPQAPVERPHPAIDLIALPIRTVTPPPLKHPDRVERRLAGV